MEFSRLKKVLAGISVAAVSLTQAGSVFAAYSDVPSGIWYQDAVEAFLDAGYLDATQARFRGGDTANRAEFVKLVVELNGGILSTPPAVPSFNDVATGAWYYGYFEEAGKEGWVRGDGDCYGSKPCYARPSANINRAEAAALIVRAFGLEWTGAAPQFVDNPSGQWYTDSIQTAADSCVLQGDDSTGRVRPGDFMNRAEMVVMLHRVDQGLTYGEDCGDEDVVAEPMIKDVVATSATTVEVEFNMAVDEEAAEDTAMYSVMNGDEVAVSSAELISVDTVELTLAEALNADGEYTVTVDGMLTADGVEFSDSMEFRGYTDVVLGEGILELSLAASNPVGDTVPKGAVGIVLLSTDFTASCDDDVVIENVTVLHEGFGDVADISGIYAAIDGARVTRKRTIDAEDQTAELRFASPLVVDACETVTVDLVADFASTATTSAEHNFVIELPSDIFGNAQEVTGNFPLRGNTFRVAAVTSGTVTVEYRTVSPDEVEVGDTAVVVGKFEVSVNSVEDQTFYSATLEQNSSASDGDFTNLAIRRTDGTVLTNTVATTVGDFATLVFDPPFTVLEGDKITLEIIADIFGGAGDSIQLHFEESSDLFAVGSLYGYGVNGQLYGSQVTLDTTPDADIVTIDAGEFTIGINGPAAQDYTRDDNDAILANVTFKTGGERIDVKDLFIAVQGQTSTGGGLQNVYNLSYDNIHEVLEDVEIRNKRTGRTVDGVRLTATNTTDGDYFTGTAAADTFQVYRFDDFVVTGDEEWEFRVDFIDNGAGNHPLSGDKFRIHICGEPTSILSAGALTDNTTTCTFGGLIAGSESYQMSVEGLSTGDKVGDVRPRGNIAGNFHRISDATLTVAVKAIGTADTAVENADNINLLRFEVRAGEAEDILLTKLIFDSESGSLINASNYALWVDTDGNGTVDTILEDGVASQSSQVSFTDLVGGGFVIPAEETVVFEVHGDIASSLVNDDLLLKFATGATSFIEAEELDDGSALSGIKQNSVACSSTTCDIILTTTRSQLWSLRNQGDLYVTEDSTPIRNRQLLGGTLGESILRLQFRAENEDVDVHFLALTSSGSDADSVDRLELYKEGQTTPFALATVGGCGQRAVPAVSNTERSFCASMQNRQLVVPEGSDMDVIVRPRMKTDNEGGISNERIAFYIYNEAEADESTTGSGVILARGDESSNPLDANSGDTTAAGEIFIGLSTAAAANLKVVGNENRSVLSKVTSITNANPDANGTAVPTGVSAIGQFKVAAAAHTNSKNGLNDVALSGIVFNVNATNVTLDKDEFFLYNKENATTRKNCEVFNSSNTTLIATNAASGSLLVECKGLISDAVSTEVDQGTDETFVLEANILNPVADGSSTSTLQVTLQGFDAMAESAFGADVSGASHIQWLDSDNDSSCSLPNVLTASTTCGTFLWIEYPETTVKSTSYTS